MIVRLNIDVEANDELLDMLREKHDVEARVAVLFGDKDNERIPGRFQGATLVHTGAGSHA